MRPRRPVRVAVAVLLAVTGCTSAARPGVAPPPPDPAAFLEPAALVAALRGGGLHLLMRHAASERGTHPDLDVDHPDDCTRQRALSAQGRRDAEAMGRAVTDLGIPVGDVVASPYCRAADTASAAFGRVRTVGWLTFLPATGTTAEREDFVDRLRATLGSVPERGTNTVLVTHNFNVEESTGAIVSEGETVVVRPDGDGGFTVVGLVPIDGWEDLAQ
jgi:phosphohistidine phosphatase SixA